MKLIVKKKLSKVRGWEAVKGHYGAKNMIDKKYERVGSPFSFSRDPSIPSIGILSAPFGNFSTISERVNE